MKAKEKEKMVFVAVAEKKKKKFVAVALACLCGADAEFIWGTATAAYQVEGSRSADGRQPSVWDAFDTADVSDVVLSVRPDGEPRVYESDNAGVADDDYNRFDETAALISAFGFGGARLSISWPRICTYDESGENFVVNERGLQHYKDVIASYKKRNVVVAATMWHWDLPLALEQRAIRDHASSAWLQSWLPLEFYKYATILVQNLEVDYWITLNEPLTIVQNGYSGGGPHAPGRCSNRTTCYDGDDGVEPYLAAKNLVLAHGYAFRAWEEAGRPGRGCGITLNSDFCMAFDPSNPADVEAATACLEFQIPLFFDPIFFGRWPDSVSKAVAPRLSTQGWDWTAAELDLVQGSHDTHLFVNHYTTRFLRGIDSTSTCYNVASFACDPKGDVSGYNFTDGTPIGTPSTNGWLYNYGAGIRHLLNWHHIRYPKRTFIITENGWGNASQASLHLELNDLERCNYYRDYISNVTAAHVEDGVTIAGYFAWSIMDNFEWADGFSTRFGLVYVDYNAQLRIPKLSSHYLARFLTGASDLTDLPYTNLPSCDDLSRRYDNDEDLVAFFSLPPPLSSLATSVASSEPSKDMGKVVHNIVTDDADTADAPPTTSL